MNKFCIITNADKDENLTVTKSIISYLEARDCVCINATKKNRVDENSVCADVTLIPKDAQCAIVLGGDGTIIHTSHVLAPLDIPILGINLGTLGYLAETERQDIAQALDAVINDQYTINERTMIYGKVIKENKVTYDGIVLNDIVVGRNGFSRIISLNVYINDELAQTLRGDGVIISTPTGSTGYNLSAGGPVVKPNSNVLIVTPICAHSISSRSIVVSADDKVTVEILKSKKSQEEEAIASFDGGNGAQMNMGDTVVISKASKKTKLISTSTKGYFDVLHNKFGNR